MTLIDVNSARETASLWQILAPRSCPPRMTSLGEDLLISKVFSSASRRALPTSSLECLFAGLLIPYPGSSGMNSATLPMRDGTTYKQD